MSTVASATQGGFLSPELFDRIIDEVHLFSDSSETSYYVSDEEVNKWGNAIDKRLSTLTSCSLVCRTWLPRSRYHIFGTTTVSFHNHASFMDLLDSPRNTFLTFVHTLCLDETLIPGDPERLGLGPGYLWLHLFLPTGFLSDFSNLKTLRISDAQFDLTDDDILAEDILGTNCSFPSIRNLSLNGCHFRTLDDVVQTLSSCTALISANLHLIDVVDPAGMLPIEFAPLSPLPQSLSSLMFPTRACPSPMQVISMASASLKHLSIGPPYVDEDSNGIIVLDLVDLQRLTDNIEYCSNLQSIAFCPVNINSFNPNSCREEVKYIPIILQKITSSSITDIIIAVSTDSVAAFDVFNWVSITKILGQKKYANLRRITIDNVNEDLMAKAKKTIAKKLKRLLVRNPSVEIVISYDKERWRMSQI